VPALRRFTTAEAPENLLVEIRGLLVQAFDGDFSDDDWEQTLGGWHVVVIGGGAVLSHAGPTFVRSGSEVIRTEDEDDGVMVLRFGPSEVVDLTAPLSCQSRRGDDW